MSCHGNEYNFTVRKCTIYLHTILCLVTQKMVLPPLKCNTQVCSAAVNAIKEAGNKALESLPGILNSLLELILHGS